MPSESYFIVLPSGLRKFLHTQDIFGFPIPVNFNGHRSFHKTSIGGVFSIIIRILYGLYFISLLHKMITYDDYETFIEEFDQAIGYKNTDLLENGVSSKDMNIQIYHTLYRFNDQGYMKPLFINEDTKKYIDVKYVQLSNDNDEAQDLTDEQRNVYSFFQAVSCTKEHFIIPESKNYDPDYNGKELFKEWEGYSVICPKTTDDIVMKGSEQTLFI